MNTRTLPCIFLVVTTGIVPLKAAVSQIAIPKFRAASDALIPPSTQQEVHLVRSLFVETNSAFDERVCESVRSIIKPPLTLSYQLISFVFTYPTTNGWVPSQTELGHPDGLLYTGDKILHASDFTNEIPLNYVRVVDSDQKEILAELEVLVRIAPLKDPGLVRTVRRSFRFVYRDTWKEIK